MTVYFPEDDGSHEDGAHTSPALNAPLRTEAQAVADRIRRRMTDHIGALVHHGALDRELASEIMAKLNAECAIARPKLRVV